MFLFLLSCLLPPELLSIIKSYLYFVINTNNIFTNIFFFECFSIWSLFLISLMEFLCFLFQYDFYPLLLSILTPILQLHSSWLILFNWYATSQLWYAKTKCSKLEMSLFYKLNFSLHFHKCHSTWCYYFQEYSLKYALVFYCCYNKFNSLI